MKQIYYQKWIMRADLLANPEALYLFGDNADRKGLGGQAKEMRGEINSIGIRTKYKPDDDEASFFNDDLQNRFQNQCDMIERDLSKVFRHLRDGGMLIIPADGLGSGLSQLPERAPMTNRFLLGQLNMLEALINA